MLKCILPIALCLLVACNNSENKGKDSTNSVTRSSVALPADSLEREATFSFIDGCMQNARVTLGDQKAFSFCKCIYDQIKAKNPGADSVAIEELARDTASVTKMAASCR